MSTVRLRAAAWRLKNFASQAVNVWRPGYHCVPSYYGASHWKLPDLREIADFGPIASAAVKSGRSCMNFDRLFIIYQSLLDVDKRFQGEDIHTAEVGVYRGGTSHFIAAVRQNRGMAGQHFAIDTFEGHPAEDIRPGMDAKQYAGSFADTSYADVKALLSPYPFVSVFKGRVQDTAEGLAADRFHFVHLDVDIYDPMIFSLRWFAKRLAPGGVMVVDDYGVTTCPGVVRAVEDFLGDANFFGLAPLTAQMVLVKLEP